MEGFVAQCLTLFFLQSFEVDLLACLTEKGDFFVLSWDDESSEIVTIIHANVNSPDCLPTRTSQLMSIDLRAQLVIIHVSVGMLQLMSYEIHGASVHFRKAVPLKVMELEIVDLSFIDPIKADPGSAVATLAVLHRLPMKMARVKTYEIASAAGGSSSSNNYTLTATNYSITELVSDVIGLARVSQPRGGFLIYSPERIFYTNPQANVIRKLVFSPTFFTCCCPVDDDGFRFLFGSSSGEIYICLLICEDDKSSFKVSQLKLERLGRTAVPSCLTYIDDGVVYVGSCHGDSSLIRLSTDAVRGTGNYFATLQTFPSLAPMTDFVVTRPNSACEQSVLIAACGSAHEGSLKRLCSGVEANCLFSVHLDCPVYASKMLVLDHSAAEHQILISSQFGQSIFLRFNLAQEAIEESTMAPLNARSQTISLFRLRNHRSLCHVTPENVFVTNVAGDKIIYTFNAPARIIHASHCDDALALAYCDGTLALFRLSEASKGFVPVFTQQFPQQMSCLVLESTSAGQLTALFSLWDNSTVGLLSFDADVANAKSKLFSYEAHICSAALLEKRYALFGSGDGSVLVVDTQSMQDSNQEVECIRLGTEPIILYSNPSARYILAHSGRDSVLLSVLRDRIVHSIVLGLPRDAFLLFSPATVDNMMHGFYALHQDTLAFYYISQSLIPRVHIDSHPVGQSVHRLAAIGDCVAALEHNFPILSVPMSHWPLMRSKLTLRDASTLALVDTFAFEHGGEQGRFAEIGWCCTVGQLQGVEGDVLVVGTCIASDDVKAERGRLLVFQLAEGRKLKLISVNEFSNGGVKAVAIVRGLVLAAIRGLNVLFKWDYAQERRLIKASASGGHIEGTSFDVRENIVVAGDALTSVSFCSVQEEGGGGKIGEFARDFQDNYITSVQLVDYSSALASDLTGNLLLLQVIRDESLNMSAAVMKGNVHLADMINTLRRADFLSRPEGVSQSFLAASAAGGLYDLHHLSTETFKLLHALQRNLSTLIKPIGGIKHAEFRRFFNGERVLERSAGFIDGDLIARFLSLSAAKRTEVLGLAPKSQMPEKITGVGVEDLMKLIESLSYGV